MMGGDSIGREWGDSRDTVSAMTLRESTVHVPLMLRLFLYCYGSCFLSLRVLNTFISLL